MEDIEKILAKRFGQEKVDELRKAYPGRKLNVIMVEDKVAVLRPVTARELSDFTITMADTEKGGLDVACRNLLDTLWIGGDEEIRDNEEYFMSSMIQIQNCVELKKSAFYKL